MKLNRNDYAGSIPRESLPIKPGDKVRVPKGTIVWDTKTGSNVELKRTQIVTVHHLISGYFTPEKSVDPTVEWSGGGGYWRSASVFDVEILEDGTN